MKPRPRPTQLAARLTALGTFCGLVEGRVPDERLAGAKELLERAGQRLDMSKEHTVVALAGATGSGKSSMFNAIAGLELSDVGVRRPTTSRTSAVVWGPDGSGELLEWLRIPVWHARETVLDAEEQAALRGLILLDLPDFDSVEDEHREEAERLLAKTDLVVWVLDPQKYADTVLHQKYLARFAQHRDVVVVALNKVDTLHSEAVGRVVGDLRGLLENDGLGAGVPVIAVSTRNKNGLPELRGLLEKAVAAKRSAQARIAADVDGVVAELSDLVGGPVRDVDDFLVRRLNSALAATAGAETVAHAVAESYHRRGLRMVGWPPFRVRGRDPLKRLGLRAGRAEGERGAGRSSLPEPSKARRASATLAMRELAADAAAEMPAPWPEAVLKAAQSEEAELPDALDRAVSSFEPVERTPVWWRLAGGLQWLFTLGVLGGICWFLAWIYVDVPAVRNPLWLVGGCFVAGVLVNVLARPLLRVGARRVRHRVLREIAEAVDRVAEMRVVAPVRRELGRYERAVGALGDAR